MEEEASSVRIGTSENASNSSVKLHSRSQTLQMANAESAQMQISRLSLEEEPSNLAGDATEPAALLQRTNMGSKPLPLRSQNAVEPTETPLREVKFDSKHEIPSSLKREVFSDSISKDQLFAEVKGLYRSLEIVEQRCTRLDQGHIADKTKTIKPEGWQALTALHRTLLYEHHDFLLASQHPSAPPELRALASERQMPFRMWKYAIHAYLELLRQHLPKSLEFMEAFIYLSYQMMALLYETVTLFEDVWTECLGDLARYRMAIENHSISVREVWTDVARYWYTKASDRQPHVGRLYHHLGILARPHLPQQLYFYNKALCSVQPFNNAKHSLKAVFEAANTILAAKTDENKNEPLQTLDATFVHMHSLICAKQPVQQIAVVVTQVQALLRKSTSHSDKKWKQYGVFLVISNMAACFSYGAFESTLRRSMEQKNYTSAKFSPKSDPWLKISIDVLSSTTEIVLSAKNEENMKNMLPLLHVLLVLLDSLCNIHRTCIEAKALLAAIPWTSIVTQLNHLSKTSDNLTEQVKNARPEQKFIPHVENDSRPLTEDFALRGLVWCRDYFPDNWFRGNSNDDLPFHEPASSETVRAQRCLWLAVKISAKSEFLRFDRVFCKFSTVAHSDEI
ncbi:Est1 DNA/RNA-binding domain-containing protein 2 [Elsinoe fawcettii]|nr:Est1 DNA/RNA-binding domain-containing protein 2 [Elsinoe fawcettii]